VWVGMLGPADVGATLYAAFREQVTAAILAGEQFKPLIASQGRFETFPAQATSLATRLRAPVYAHLVKRDTAMLPPGDTWESLGARALAAAVGWLAASLGPDQSRWSWGTIHRTRPKHTLSAAFPDLAELLDPPSVGVGGDSDTPQAGSYAAADGKDFTLASMSVTRYCFDLADWDNSGWTLPLGASGHPGSAHFADQVTAWSEQKLHPMLYSWNRIEADAETRQRLTPA
jgi:penicillin amidase